MGERGDRTSVEDEGVVLDILGGDLEAAEDESSAAWIEPGGGDGVEHLADGDLDGATVLENGELEGLFRVEFLLSGEPMEAGVEVAVAGSAEGGGAATGTIRHDVTTH